MAQTLTISVSKEFFTRHPFETSDGRHWASLRCAADAIRMSGAREGVKYHRPDGDVDELSYADAMAAPPLGRP